MTLYLVFFVRLGGAERCNRFKGQLKTTRNGQSSKVGCPAEADILEVGNRLLSSSDRDYILNATFRRPMSHFLRHFKADMHSQPCQTFEIGFLAEIVDFLQPLTISQKSPS